MSLKATPELSRIGRSKCFPGLMAGEPVPSALPSVVQTTAEEASLILRISEYIHGSASGLLENTASIRFVDVAVKTASAGDLRDHLSSQKCSYLSQAVNSRFVYPETSTPLPVVVGRIVTGRAEMFVGLTEQGSAQAGIDAKVLAEIAGFEGSVIDAKAAASLGSCQIVVEFY